MKPVNVVISGAAGKMGRVSVDAVQAEHRFELIGVCHTTSELAEKLAHPGIDVVIDFTRPEVVKQHTQLIIDAGHHPVIGTTGLTSEDIHEFQKQCQALNLGGAIVPNFSIGAALVGKMAKLACQHLKQVEIIEYHHEQKIDKPSGTSLHLAHTLQESMGSLNDIPIHAIRLPGYLAHQEVLWGGMSETLSLRHDTQDRKCFMPGLLKTTEAVCKMNTLVWGMEDILWPEQN